MADPDRCWVDRGKCWVDRGKYWLFDAEQRSKQWHSVREGRPSGSTFAACLGLSKFSTPNQAAQEITGLITKEFSEKSKKNIKGEQKR